jgi:hypothetical protein
MTQTYLLLVAAWIMFGCMIVVALAARRRSKKLDRLIAETQRAAHGQAEQSASGEVKR